MKKNENSSSVDNKDDIKKLNAYWESFYKGVMAGKKDKGYTTITNKEELNKYITSILGDKVKDIELFEKGRSYPYNSSYPYREDIYFVTLKDGTTFKIIRSYGKPRWEGNVDYKEQIIVENIKKMAKGGAVMSDGKFKLRGFPPIDKVELMGLYNDFKENFSSKIERFTKHLNKVHNSKLRLIDIKELMDYAKMNFVSKGGMIEYHDYKGVEIMYEPTYEEYFVNDLVFNTLEKAHKYIDSGEANETPTYIQNLYRRGAMAKGGSVVSKENSIKEFFKKFGFNVEDIQKDEYSNGIEGWIVFYDNKNKYRVIDYSVAMYLIVHDKTTNKTDIIKQSKSFNIDNFAKGGSIKNGYMVFNYNDNLYATNEVFQTKNDAKRFIDEFKKRFVLQGYYRDSNMNKIDINNVDLYVLDADFNPYKFSEGGCWRTRYEGGIVTYANLDLNTNRNIIAKAIEFISGTGVDAESMTLEGKEIRFKYRTSNTYTTISQKLISDTISTNRKSLELRGKNFAKGGSVNDFSEYNFQVGDKLDLGSKGIKYFKQYDGEKIIVVDSKSDLKSSKGSYTYPSSVKKVLNKRYSNGGGIADDNKNKLWYEVLQKFFKIFYGEYEDDTAEKHIKDSQVTTDQAKYYYENFMDKYKTERTLSDGFKIFKQSLTKEELDSIQISFNSEDYADAEEHDTQKRYSTITIKKKENFKKGGIVVTSIKDIPNFEQRNKENKITYRGLGLGKLFDDFYDIAGEQGTRIKVDGKEYFITNTEFNTFSRDSDGRMRIRFDAPNRNN